MKKPLFEKDEKVKFYAKPAQIVSEPWKDGSGYRYLVKQSHVVWSANERELDSIRKRSTNG